MARTIKASKTQHFQIKLISKKTSEILLRDEMFQQKVLHKLLGNTSFDDKDLKLVETNIERIRELRDASAEREKKRVRERDKVATKLFAIITHLVCRQ